MDTLKNAWSRVKRNYTCAKALTHVWKAAGRGRHRSDAVLFITEIKEGAYNQWGLIDVILCYTCPPTILDHCTMTYAVILG